MPARKGNAFPAQSSATALACPCAHGAQAKGSLTERVGLAQVVSRTTTRGPRAPGSEPGSAGAHNPVTECHQGRQVRGLPAARSHTSEGLSWRPQLGAGFKMQLNRRVVGGGGGGDQYALGVTTGGPPPSPGRTLRVAIHPRTSYISRQNPTQGYLNPICPGQPRAGHCQGGW